ncbi:MAG: hypothetical protein JWR64_1219, partial [Marmoricola sp.]|nr:hypothetical protein [Marmoricola sp.]
MGIDHLGAQVAGEHGDRDPG